uniref:(California timema) hypothetical protein n=1 Tax=Timema californicum TaxID=61474 RepID=A0A7R9J338_TIMCA|nr:unnamed protein product [Timema californicum]
MTTRRENGTKSSTAEGGEIKVRISVGRPLSAPVDSSRPPLVLVNRTTDMRPVINVDASYYNLCQFELALSRVYLQHGETMDVELMPYCRRLQKENDKRRSQFYQQEENIPVTRQNPHPQDHLKLTRQDDNIQANFNLSKQHSSLQDSPKMSKQGLNLQDRLKSSIHDTNIQEHIKSLLEDVNRQVSLSYSKNNVSVQVPRQNVNIQVARQNVGLSNHLKPSKNNVNDNNILLTPKQIDNIQHCIHFARKPVNLQVSAGPENSFQGRVNLSRKDDNAQYSRQDVFANDRLQLSRQYGCISPHGQRQETAAYYDWRRNSAFLSSLLPSPPLPTYEQESAFKVMAHDMEVCRLLESLFPENLLRACNLASGVQEPAMTHHFPGDQSSILPLSANNRYNQTNNKTSEINSISTPINTISYHTSFNSDHGKLQYCVVSVRNNSPNMHGNFTKTDNQQEPVTNTTPSVIGDISPKLVELVSVEDVLGGNTGAVEESSKIVRGWLEPDFQALDKGDILDVILDLEELYVSKNRKEPIVCTLPSPCKKRRSAPAHAVHQQIDARQGKV